MNTHGKKYISPGAWFSLIYPQDWYEFEDTESTFLFYNPNKWTGNFRISAYKQDSRQSDAACYAENALKDELKQNSSAVLVKVGKWNCAYSKETFQEEGVYYTSHCWITGVGNLLFECTFTVPKGGDITMAQQIIASLEDRKEEMHYPEELIPIRVLEIGEVNSAFEWVSSTVKKLLKKDFTGIGEDIPKIQQIIDERLVSADQREAWRSFGLAFGTILTNEADGMEWMTAIDGKREYPALLFRNTEVAVYPQDLIWEKIKNEGKCNLREEFDKILSRLS